MAFYMNGITANSWYNSFGVELVPKEITGYIGNKNIKTNKYRVQPNDSIMCRYFCIGFIDFTLKSKSLLDYTNLFSTSEYEKE